MKIKNVIGIILLAGGLIGLVVCGIAAGIFYWQNPDMTTLRRLLEYPEPTIWAVVCYIAGRVGLRLSK